MPGNSFGEVFRVTTFGESHGGAVGVVIDGCPPGVELSEADIQPELDRRRPGQSAITTPRSEKDTIHLQSGVFEGVTTGTPILMLAHNLDARPEDYDTLKSVYRPSHADFTYERKYGRRDWRGSGRASARETLARVAAGAVAKKILKLRTGTEVLAYVTAVAEIECCVDPATVTSEQVEANDIRCPDPETAIAMIDRVAEVRDASDSVGGVIQGVARQMPVGLGDPVFDKLPATLAHGMMSINAVKGFEIGSGFSGTRLRGSEHNDEFFKDRDGVIRPRTNRAGGTLGGISTGEDLLFRVAFKPVATIGRAQSTVDQEGQPHVLEAPGRHDPCVLPRAVPIVEAMTALVLVDHWLRHRAQNQTD